MLKTSNTCEVLRASPAARGECGAPAIANVTHAQRPLTFAVCAAHAPNYTAPAWRMESR